MRLDARGAAAPARIHARELAQREADACAYGLSDGIEAGRAEAEAEMDEQWARLADLIRQSGSPRSRSFAERRAAELERVRTGSQATGPELAERARRSMENFRERPDPPTGLPRITWDGTYRPMRPDAVWTAADEYRFQAHQRDRKSGGKAA